MTRLVTSPHIIDVRLLLQASLRLDPSNLVCLCRPVIGRSLLQPVHLLTQCGGLAPQIGTEISLLPSMPLGHHIIFISPIAIDRQNAWAYRLLGTCGVALCQVALRGDVRKLGLQHPHLDNAAQYHRCLDQSHHAERNRNRQTKGDA